MTEQPMHTVAHLIVAPDGTTETSTIEVPVPTPDRLDALETTVASLDETVAVIAAEVLGG